MLSACGGGGGGSSSSSDSLTVSSIDIVASTNTLPKGAVLQLALTGDFSDGNTYEISAAANWASSNPAVASVDDNGTVLAVGVGSAQISVDLFADGSFTNRITVNISAPDLLGVEITPSVISLAKGSAARLTATGRFSDGSREDISSTASWAAVDNAIASVDDSSADGGMVTALLQGSTVVSAELDGVSATATVNVSDASLESIEISYPQSGLAQGTTYRLQATGVYSDNSSLDLTEAVTWSSLDPSVISVIASTGEITAVNLGATSLSAELGSVSASVNIDVTSAVLQSLELQPSISHLYLGRSIELSVIGHYSDNTIQDLTEQASWTSSVPATASVNDSAGSRGLVTGLAAGVVDIEATVASETASVSVEVVDAALNAIHILPSSVSLAIGTQRRLSASGIYAGGGYLDLSDQVTWESSDSAIAAIDSSGQLTAVSVGTARISARLGGVVGSMEAVITNGVLQSIAIGAELSTQAAGTVQTLTATASFDTGSPQDVTAQVSWSVDNSSVASVSNAAGSKGQLMALSVGSVTVTATLGEVSQTQVVTVSAATLSSLQVSPASLTLAAGASEALTVTGTFSDSSTQDLTDQVVWSSDDSGVATVSNASVGAGLVAGIVPGSTSINAYFDGITESVVVTVNNAPATPVSLTVVAAPNMIYADGEDSTILTIDVQAADPSSTVADNTQINLSIITGSGTITPTAFTTDGQVTVTLTSATQGILVVDACVDGTDVRNTVPIISTLNFLDGLGMFATLQGDVSGGSLPAGSSFGFFVSNLTNRNLSVDRFVFGIYDDSNDSVAILLQTTDPVKLNNNVLAGGGNIGFVIKTDAEFPLEDYTSIYALSDPVTEESFTAGVFYRLAE